MCSAMKRKSSTPKAWTHSSAGFATGSQPASRWTNSLGNWSLAAAAPMRILPPTSTGPIATRRRAAKRRLGCFGVRLQCAKCHNHPYDRWTQDDYYNWAAVFGRIDYQIVSNQRRDRLDKHEFNGEQIVVLKDEGEVQNARTGQDAEPTFLGGYSPPLHPIEDRLMPLADWLTAPENELFVKSQVNFIWYHLVSRGLVEPIDDFRVTNPPSDPALLDALARRFAGSDFDLKTIVRDMLNSLTYQLSSEPNESNADDEDN